MAKKRDTRPRLTTSRPWIERGPLTPWMYRYICWLAEQPDSILSQKRIGKERVPRRRPPTIERCVQATKFAGRRISFSFICILEQRPDVVDYFTKLRNDAQYKARELAMQQLAKNLEARDRGLDRALDTKNDGKDMDPRLVEQYTRPFIDVAFPKKKEDEAPRTRITVNLLGNAEAQKLLQRVLGEEEVPEIEYEVIETKRLESGDDSN